MNIITAPPNNPHTRHPSRRNPSAADDLKARFRCIQPSSEPQAIRCLVIAGIKDKLGPQFVTCTPLAIYGAAHCPLTTADDSIPCRPPPTPSPSRHRDMVMMMMIMIMIIAGTMMMLRAGRSDVSMVVRVRCSIVDVVLFFTWIEVELNVVDLQMIIVIVGYDVCAN